MTWEPDIVRTYGVKDETLIALQQEEVREFLLYHAIHALTDAVRRENDHEVQYQTAMIHALARGRGEIGVRAAYALQHERQLGWTLEEWRVAGERAAYASAPNLDVLIVESDALVKEELRPFADQWTKEEYEQRRVAFMYGYTGEFEKEFEAFRGTSHEPDKS